MFSGSRAIPSHDLLTGLNISMLGREVVVQFMPIGAWGFLGPHLVLLSRPPESHLLIFVDLCVTVDQVRVIHI